MKEPKDVILPMLKEMRAEIAALRARMDERFDENDKAHKSFKHALSADTLMAPLLQASLRSGSRNSKSMASGSKGWKAKFAHSRAARDRS
jgi:hypothetical protein